MTAQCEGMGEVGSARYEPALLPPCQSIRVLSYSNCQRSTHASRRAWQCKCLLRWFVLFSLAFPILLPYKYTALNTAHFVTICYQYAVHGLSISTYNDQRSTKCKPYVSISIPTSTQHEIYIFLNGLDAIWTQVCNRLLPALMI